MVDYNKTYISEDVIQYSFIKTQNGLASFTFWDFIRMPKHQEKDEFIKAIHLALEESRRVFGAYFWECPSVSRDTVDRPFEFVTVQAPRLRTIRQDPSSFKEKFSGHKYVCSFLNLGGDAMLVSPVPESGKDFSHMAKFNHEVGNIAKIGKFWEKVSEELGNALTDNEPKWLSTNGMGVYYLHVRIDDRPKYYQFRPYKARPEARSKVVASRPRSYGGAPPKTDNVSSIIHVFDEVQDQSSRVQFDPHTARPNAGSEDVASRPRSYGGTQPKTDNVGSLIHEYGKAQDQFANLPSHVQPYETQPHREGQTTYGYHYGWRTSQESHSVDSEKALKETKMEVDQANADSTVNQDNLFKSLPQ